MTKNGILSKIKIPFFYCIKGAVVEDFICKIIILFSIVGCDSMLAGFAMISDFLPDLSIPFL
jgi:hypothetical protein